MQQEQPAAADESSEAAQQQSDETAQQQQQQSPEQVQPQVQQAAQQQVATASSGNLRSNRPRKSRCKSRLSRRPKPSAVADRTPIQLGGDRPATLLLPGDLSAPIPLVMLLHGYTMSAESIDRFFGISGRVETDRFALIVPDGTENASGRPVLERDAAVLRLRPTADR